MNNSGEGEGGREKGGVTKSELLDHPSKKLLVLFFFLCIYFNQRTYENTKRRFEKNQNRNKNLMFCKVNFVHACLQQG